MNQIRRCPIEDDQVHGSIDGARQLVRQIQLEAFKGAGRILLEQQGDVDVAPWGLVSTSVTPEEVSAN